MLKLDFTIITSKEREKFITELLQDKTIKYTQKEIETMGNYILYGKDSDDGTSCVDRKEVQINTKYGSYKKKEPESLEALLDNPNFNEGIFIKKNNHYKTIKQTIDREKDADIPSIQELWAEIDRIQYRLDVSTGKKEDLSIQKYEGIQLYKMKHFLIDLRRQQFYLKDMFKPQILQYGSSAHQTLPTEESGLPWGIENSDYDIAPLGVITINDKRFYSPREAEERDYTYNKEAKYLIDFRNPEHIYLLFESYCDMWAYGEDRPESILNNIIKTLDFYTTAAELSETKQFILECKKLRMQNEEIRIKLKEKFGLTHTSNYISTIWKRNICGGIAEAAVLHYDYYLNRESQFAWKRCNKCGEIKLKDIREFVRKAKSSDGLSSRCKKCDKEDRKTK